MLSREKAEKALKGKKLPIVVLDHKWHQLFRLVEKTPEISSLEQKLNELLKRQGKVNTEMKDIRKIKKKLMDEIVELMEESDAASEKKSDDNRNLIEDCNEKLAVYEDEMLDLPNLIRETNYNLMVETMDACYNSLRFNETELESIGEWIKNVRIELKKNIVRKQEMEITNQEIYSFMHDTFGAEVIDIFDMKYLPEEHPVHKPSDTE